MMKNLASFDLPKHESNGSFESIDPIRRRYCRGLVAGVLGLAGCGGGGGGSSGDSSGDDGQTQTPTGNVPPASGAFGGGQGKILYVEHTIAPKTLMELDLATRAIRGVARVEETTLTGGVTRAADGSFLLTGDGQRMSASMRAYLYRSDGSLVKSFDLQTTTTTGAALSPDGRSIVYAGLSYDYGPTGPKSVLFAAIIDVQSGEIISKIMLGLADPPANKIPLGVAAQSVWTPDSTPYVAIPGALYRIDRVTAAATKVHEMDQSSPHSLAVSPDGRQIWYESVLGSPVEQCLWSIDIATGEKKQRVVRSKRGRQHAPGFSPDGKWLLMTQGRAEYTGIGFLDYSEISAIPLPTGSVDTENIEPFILNSSGEKVGAYDRMVWY